MNETNANKTTFATQLDVDPSPKSIEPSSSTNKPIGPLRIVLSMAVVFVCVLVILVFGGLVLKGQSSSISMTRSSTSEHNPNLLPSKSSTSLRYSSHATTSGSVSKTANTADLGDALSSRSGILATIRQRPKVTAAIITITVIVIVGAVVASVFLLSPSPHVDGMDDTSGSTKPDHGNKPSPPPPSGLSAGAIAGIVIGAVVLVLVVVAIAMLIKNRQGKGPINTTTSANLGVPKTVKPLINNYAELHVENPYNDMSDQDFLSLNENNKTLSEYYSFCPKIGAWNNSEAMRHRVDFILAKIIAARHHNKFQIKDRKINLFDLDGNLIGPSESFNLCVLFQNIVPDKGDDISPSLHILVECDTFLIPKQIDHEGNYMAVPVGNLILHRKEVDFWQNIYKSLLYMLNSELREDERQLKSISRINVA